MSKTKIGIFSILAFGIMMLLIPATSIASAAEYDKYYKEKNDRYSNEYGYGNDRPYEKIQYKEDERYYDEYRQNDYGKSYDNEYKKIDKKENDRPVIIVDNKIPIPHKEKEKKKDPPMLTVNKEVLFCDLIANGTSADCADFSQIPPTVPGPNSDRYVQNCTEELCQGIDDSSFEIKVENANIFEGDEDGTKLNFNGERFTVTEENSNAVETALVGIDPAASLEIELTCQESGFDSSYVFGIPDKPFPIISCVNFEGDCSGFVQYGESKECTVTNHIVGIGIEDE